MLNQLHETSSSRRQEPVLIVNADDFGLNAAANTAIVRGFQNRWCSSTTLMANMEGFDEACELIHEHNLFEHVGYHLNLSEGFPLTEGIRRYRRLCDSEGRFRLLRRERVLCLSLMECHAVAAELRAQIGRLRSRGIPITHLDSHKHLHEELGILRVVIPIVKEAGIPYIRRLRNIGASTSPVKSGYRAALNAWLEHEGLLRTRFYGSLGDFRHETENGAADAVCESCEIMVHPTLDAEGRVIDLMSHEPLDALRNACGIPLRIVSYSGTVYGLSAPMLQRITEAPARDLAGFVRLTGT